MKNRGRRGPEGDVENRGAGRGFQDPLRDLANVNVLENIV